MNSKYSIPPYGGMKINNSFFNLLDWTPFLIGVFQLIQYNTFHTTRAFQYDHRVAGLAGVTIALGAINMLMPWDDVLRKFMKF